MKNKNNNRITETEISKQYNFCMRNHRTYSLSNIRAHNTHHSNNKIEKPNETHHLNGENGIESYCMSKGKKENQISTVASCSLCKTKENKKLLQFRISLANR